ncbi:MAG: hydrogenase iron-sulfur subunit [Desulfonatronovibrionaceae bacterium]
MPEKIGVYICTGCDIGEQDIDFEQLKEHVDDEVSPALIKELPFLCGNEGVAEIKKDIEEGNIDGVCVAACSPRVMWDVFDFGLEIPVERVNIRELAVWSFKEPEGLPPLEETDLEANALTMMLQDYIKMGVTRLEKTAPPEPDIPEVSKAILVLGGGHTGLNAAQDAASMGYDVVLVEKEDKLGGFAARMYKQLPYKFPYTEPQTPQINELISAVENNDKIKVLTGSELESLSGSPAMYKAVVKSGEEQQELDVGAVVLATGWKPYDASKLDSLGYGKLKNVVTNIQFEEMAAAGSIKRPSDDAPARSVAFIQCAGQRDPEHLPYCSSVCCMTSLKQAGYIREKDPEAKAYIFYKDMRTPGVYESYYQAAQDDPGIFLTKSEVREVSEGEDGKVRVQVSDTLLGDEDLEVEVDILVLTVGMVPTTAEDTFEDGVLKLGYRQGQQLPELELFNGFADSNYICFPYETRRTGIYSAGCVRQPMNLATAEDDAAGAALKAVQCLESTNRGMAVHPRSGDLTYPKFNMVRCTQCKRCTEECPFGALDEDEKGTPLPNPTRCRRCGTCMGACPERVISFDNYSVSMLNEMIGQIEVPEDEEEGGYRFLVLVCENDAYPALDMAAMRKRSWSSYVRFIPVRCLGSVNTQWIAEAMSKGIDGVLLLGCKFGDDYQCHFMKGSELCSQRMANIGETLERLQVEAERVHQEEVAIDDYNRIPDIIDDFIAKIEDFGPNPYKGF